MHAFEGGLEPAALKRRELGELSCALNFRGSWGSMRSVMNLPGVASSLTCWSQGVRQERTTKNNMDIETSTSVTRVPG